MTVISVVYERKLLLQRTCKEYGQQLETLFTGLNRIFYIQKIQFSTKLPMRIIFYFWKGNEREEQGQSKLG